MKKFDINDLNEEQKQALLAIDGAVLVTAGAGSGKTRLLTHRIAYMLEKGISPFSILAITFTNKATNEMKERVATLVDNSENIWISTFHSMCVRILRRDLDKLDVSYSKNFTIYSDSDSDKVLKDIFNSRNIDDDKFRKNVSYHLSNWKNNTLSLGEYAEEFAVVPDIHKICNIIAEYEDTLRKNNALDFDDLLSKTYQLFKRCPEVLEYYANRFQYILVDEFQDTNVVQYELVKMLSAVHGNIFVVGDEDQCIYSWRGANFRNIFNFKKDFNDVQVFKLERNYRSSKSILNSANALIKNNQSRLEKTLWTDKPEGNKPEIYNAGDERDEALHVASTIKALVARGRKYSDFAVLMRVNALSQSLEEALLSYNIPHKFYGGFKFYERAEVKSVLAYLRLFVNPKDDVAFEKVINFPKRGIGEGALNKIRAYTEGASMLSTLLSYKMADETALLNKAKDFIDAYRNLEALRNTLTLSEFVSKVVSDFKIKSAYLPMNEENQSKIMNIDALISAVEEFEDKNPEATLEDYLENVTLVSDMDTLGDDGSVVLATIHAVKGLEFKVVFVVGAEEGIFPLERCNNSANELEEERRLMYVAVTRAEELLYLSYCTKRYMYGQTKYQMASRFTRELGLFAGKTFKMESETKRVDVKTFFNKIDWKTNSVKEEKSQKDVSKYKVGQRVEHPKYEVGQIISISSDGLVGDIEFEGFGKKSLMLNIADLTILGGEDE